MFLKERKLLIVLFLRTSIVSSHHLRQVEGKRTIIIVIDEKSGIQLRFLRNAMQNTLGVSVAKQLHNVNKLLIVM